MPGKLPSCMARAALGACVLVLLVAQAYPRRDTGVVALHCSGWTSRHMRSIVVAPAPIHEFDELICRGMSWAILLHTVIQSLIRTDFSGVRVKWSKSLVGSVMRSSSRARWSGIAGSGRLRY